MASLKPDMGIDGNTGAIDDVLNEIGTTGEDGKKHQNIMNDDIEEKDSAI